MPYDGNPQDYTTETETQRVLRKAAQIVRERGLVTSRFVTSDGSVCGVCAIAIAEGRMTDLNDWEPWHTDAARDGETGQFFRHFIGGTKIDAWVMGRTAEEVASALEAAADSLETRDG